MSGVGVAGVGILTGWGEGTAALPADAVIAAAGRRVVAAAAPVLDGERFRRATRECRLGVAAVDAALRQANLAREAVGGGDTALVYVTAAAYGAANRGFIEASGGTLHFPYTAPSAVPAEVAIEFGLCGAYVILIGGAATTVEALGHAAGLVARGACQRALVVAVETFEECEALYARGRWLARGPLVEAAACAVLGPGDARVALGPGRAPSDREMEARRRAGETLAVGPLIALALALEAGGGPAAVSGRWRGSRVTLQWRAPATPG